LNKLVNKSFGLYRQKFKENRFLWHKILYTQL